MIESFYKKIRLVFIPYLFVLAACLVSYSFLNWRFYLKTPSRLLPEGIMLIAAPIGFALVAVLIFLRPRLRLLTVKAERTHPQFSLNMLSMMAIAIPLILLQYLLLTASSDLTRINAPSDIVKGSYAKYYSAPQFADLRQYVYKRFVATKGNKGRTFTYHQYFAMPLIDKVLFKNCFTAGDTLEIFVQLFNEHHMPPVWLCMEYKMKISKKNNTQEEEDAFLEHNEKDFAEKDFSTITYMDRLGKNNLQAEYRKTILTENSKRELILLDAKFSSFEERNDHMLIWTIMGTLMSMGFMLLIFGIYSWDELRLQQFEDKKRVW